MHLRSNYNRNSKKIKPPSYTYDKKDTSTNTSSTSYVKTGIKSIAYVGIILVIALGAFAILNKNKDKK